MRLFFICIVNLLVLACSTTIPIEFPQFPEGNSGEHLRQVMAGSRRIAVITRDSNIRTARSEWQSTLQAKLTSSIQEKGYYTIVDIDSRRHRIDEIAHTQSGLTDEALAIGHELAVDAFLIVEMTAPPRSECQIEELVDMFASSMNLAQAVANEGESSEEVVQRKPTGVRYLTIFARGTMVSVETGRSVSHTNTKSFRLQNSVGDTNCPSELNAFSGALEMAATEIATRLSPNMRTVRIPLSSDVDDVRSRGSREQAQRVEEYLKDGIEWVKAGDLEQASRSWERALRESNGRSVAASWNMATYYWSTGQMYEAERHFQNALDQAGPSWMTSRRRYIWTLFRREQERLSMGRNQY